MHKRWTAIGLLALGMASCFQPSTVSSPSPPECASPSQSPSADPGAIAGQLSYPSDFIPAMTVYAIPVSAIRASAVRASATCYQTAQTVLNQPTFHVVDLAPGDYYVLATWFPAVVAASDSRAAFASRSFGGAYTRAVACGLKYTCTDHSLVPVTVHAGKVTSGIGVTDWYADQGEFPEVPSNASQPVRLAPATAFSSATNAAIYTGQLATGGVYTERACPANRACLAFGPQHDGSGSAYFVGVAGSNTDLLACGVYVSSDPAGWHGVDVGCKSRSPAFPAVGASGVVTGLMGDTECVNVRLTPGRSGKAAGCLALGTLVEIDDGPAFVPDTGVSLGASDRLWWHLKGRGWMVHTYLRNG